MQEDGLYLLMQELQRGLEEPARRRGAATVVALFCKSSKLDFQEHVPTLIGVRGRPRAPAQRRRRPAGVGRCSVCALSAGRHLLGSAGPCPRPAMQGQGSLGSSPLRCRGPAA